MISYIIYAGSFNPIHAGHVLTISYLSSLFDHVIVVPSNSHPDGKQLLKFKHRVEMCAIACDQFRTIILDTLEIKIDPPNFSYKTVKSIVEKYQHSFSKFNFAIGSDLIDNFETWENVDIIKKLAPPIFIGRAGYSHEKAGPAIVPEVSSTEIRKLLKEDQNCKRLEQLVPRNVLQYIKKNGLYR